MSVWLIVSASLPLKLDSEEAREQSYVLPKMYTLCLPTGVSALSSPDQEEICGVHVRVSRAGGASV